MKNKPNKILFLETEKGLLFSVLSWIFTLFYNLFCMISAMGNYPNDSVNISILEIFCQAQP
jgi:hypothetical protein